METGSFQFDRFLLDPRDRQLRQDGVPVELNGRYLDALTLLVREQGRLVTKSRFLDEVWRGVPVTDEALTQCIKTLRRQLGDEASRPRFIETVPKHGYRFIAPVEQVQHQAGGATAARPTVKLDRWRQALWLGAAGTLGGGWAGLLGGLIYGFGAASQPLQPGMGAVSVLLVIVCLSVVVALVGAAGVSFGIAATSFASDRQWLWRTAGGGVGGLIVGALTKLLGLDAFNLLLGRSPGDITGAMEGLVLGAAVGFGTWLGGTGKRRFPLRLGMSAAALSAGVAGMMIGLLGGRLMGGSLELLARSFPDSRLRLDQIGKIFGEDGFGPISQVVTGGLEGALFGGFIAGAMILAGRALQTGR